MRIIDILGTGISLCSFGMAWYFGKEALRAKRDIGRSDMPSSDGDPVLRNRAALGMLTVCLVIGYGTFPDVFEKSPLEVFRQTTR